jgi:phosphate transport system protein
MVEKFHGELDEVKKQVLKMGALSKKMLKASVKALKEEDEKHAQWVMNQKAKLADLDDKIEEKTFRLIALYQPMARDMREIACILKMITYLNRIGRYGKDIAKIYITIKDEKTVKKLVNIPHMAELVISMIDDSLKTFKDNKIERFNDFVQRESDVDAMRYSIFRECLTYMMEDPKKIERCTNYVMVARYLERCADHACKMAEKIYYMITGERVEIDCREDTNKSCFIGVAPEK